MKRCATCKRKMAPPGGYDCGGDCLQCMASFLDPDCMDSLLKLRGKEISKARLLIAALLVAVDANQRPGWEPNLDDLYAYEKTWGKPGDCV